MKKLLFESIFNIFLHSLCLAVGYGIAYVSYSVVDISSFDPVLGTLQNISAAVFTLAGIWIAYSYPAAITAFSSSDKVKILKGTENYDRVKKLVLTIFASAFVLVCILIINIVKPIVLNMTIFNTCLDEFKIFFITFVIYLTLIQLKAILNIMVNNFNFVFTIATKKAEQKVVSELDK